MQIYNFTVVCEMILNHILIYWYLEKAEKYCTSSVDSRIVSAINECQYFVYRDVKTPRMFLASLHGFQNGVQRCTLVRNIIC
jgi:hypothetical protein